MDDKELEFYVSSFIRWGYVCIPFDKLVDVCKELCKSDYEPIVSLSSATEFELSRRFYLDDTLQ